MEDLLKPFRLFVMSIILLIITPVVAQSTFFKTYDFPGDDAGAAVIQCSDGGYAIIGHTNSSGAGDYDAWLIKTDAEGDILWSQTYGDTGSDMGYDLCETSDLGFIVAASKTVANVYTQGWVFKTDASGNMDWEYIYGTDYNGEGASSIVSAGNDTYLVSGNINSKSHVLKIDENGNPIWEQSYFSAHNSSTTSICRVNENIFAVVGSFQYSGGGAWFPNLFTIDPEGILYYQLTYPNEGFFQYVTGTFDQGMVFGGNEGGMNSTHKILNDGFYAWDYYYSSQYLTMATAAAQTSDSNIVVSDNSFYASLRKLDNLNGDTLWTESSTYNNMYPKYTNLKTTLDNALIITGYTDDDDLILVKAMQNGSLSGFSDHKYVGNKISIDEIYPNPFEQQTNLNFSVQDIMILDLYINDINGKCVRRIVKKTFSPGNYTFSWDGNSNMGESCSAGIYIAVLKSNTGLYLATKLIKK